MFQVTSNSLNIFQTKFLIFFPSKSILSQPTHPHTLIHMVTQAESTAAFDFSLALTPHTHACWGTSVVSDSVTLWTVACLAPPLSVILQEALSGWLSKCIPKASICLHPCCLCTSPSHDRLSPGPGHSPRDRPPDSSAVNYPGDNPFSSLSLWLHRVKPWGGSSGLGHESPLSRWLSSPPSQPHLLLDPLPLWSLPRSLVFFLFLENAKLFPSSRLYVLWHLPESCLRTLNG